MTGPSRPSSSRRGYLGCFGVGLWLAVVTAAAPLVFVVADHLGGSIVGALAVVSMFASPLGIGVALERIASKLGRELRAERVALYLAPLFSVGLLVLSCTLERQRMGAALAAVPARYAWTRGLFGEAVRRLGLALNPGAEPAPIELPVPRPSSAPSRLDETRPSTAPKAENDASVGSELYASGDASYREDPSCETLSDVSEISAAYKPGAKRAAANALGAARYATGLPFLKAQNDAQLLAWFSGAPDSFEGVASRFDAAVHEGSHIWGFTRFSLGTQSYPVRQDLTVEAKRLKNFPRSEILNVHVDRDADSYAKTYLEGASGAQGFNSLLDEYNAYAHSLASRYCTRDLLSGDSRVSARDGILTFMYYVETYLELARTRHDAQYAAILADSGHRKVILTVWDRAELWLRRSASHSELGIADEKIRGWVYDPARLAEVTRVRDAELKKPRLTPVDPHDNR